MTDLIIIGAGAAGLMAACAAGEAKLSCILLEKRHRPGLKLLMCGNNRCNVSHAGSAEELIEQYGQHSGIFFKSAIMAFPPQSLREWLLKNGVTTVILKNRIYPKSEKADDILHCFTDKIRDLEIPFCTNAGVKSIDRVEGGFRVNTENFSIEGRNILIATGGISYPKTGSTGDGNGFAEKFGLKTAEWRPALGAIDANSPWFNNILPGESNHFPVKVTVVGPNNSIWGTTAGNILLEKGILRGSAIFDAVRLAARNTEIQGKMAPSMTISIDMFPELPAKVLAEKINVSWKKLKNGKGLINALGVDHGFCNGLSLMIEKELQNGDFKTAADKLKAIRLEHATVHPAKEAIVCGGGIDISEIDDLTMEARQIPGLYFAGEAIDAEGPTGGYNLQAAFATARLAVTAINAKIHPPVKKSEKHDSVRESGGQNAKREKSKSIRKSSWGKDFWASASQRDFKKKEELPFRRHKHK